MELKWIKIIVFKYFKLCWVWNKGVYFYWIEFFLYFLRVGNVVYWIIDNFWICVLSFCYEVINFGLIVWLYNLLISWLKILSVLLFFFLKELLYDILGVIFILISNKR